ncbi:MAG: hydroxymethylbilane synthase [Synergistaceae bacterium]|jgi:hydroxymethylbilane synthase|nr:hydroxymethylbilane synthase [Synergistaceae bacterium]
MNRGIDAPNPYRLLVSLNLEEHEILVVGGGGVAERKIATLLGCRSRVRMVSPDATDNLAELARDGALIWERRIALGEDFASHVFAVLAVPRRAADALASLARANNCAVDICADAGAGGDFALCAQFAAEGLFVGVSGGGRNPAAAAAAKRRLMKSMRETMTLLTRGSRLALCQAGMWVEVLARAGMNAAVKTVTSHGDRDRRGDLSAFGFGAFVKALEDELLSGKGDFAVHSAKDMPAILPAGCALAAVLRRSSRRDVMLTGSALRGAPSGEEVILSLPQGARVGTSSARRRAQVSSLRPDVACLPCRGNIETRISRLADGEFDAIILAEAGLERLGLNAENACPLSFLTSAGQGAIAAEAVAGSEAESALKLLNHVPTWYEVAAERAFLSRLSAGCSYPVAVNAVYDCGEMNISAEIYSAQAGIAPAVSSVRGSVRSAGDAIALSTALWDEMSGFPAVRLLNEGRAPS